MPGHCTELKPWQPECVFWDIRHLRSEATILIDPFLNDNSVAPVVADELTADTIVVRHGHGDHVGDTVCIACYTGTLVIANFEVVNWLNQPRVEKVTRSTLADR